MVAEIISIGTELLLGNIANTNAQYLSRRLADLGIELYYQTVVGDNQERIKNALDVAYSRADMVITTGGLGPTKDDMTKERIIEYFGFKPVFDEKACGMLADRLKGYGMKSVSEAMLKQAVVPEGALVLYNYHGTATGCCMEKDGHICILLPGPPSEMKPMFEECCELYLNSLADRVILSHNIYLVDIDHAPITIVGEAPVAEAIEELLDGENPTVATYAGDRRCRIRVTASARNKEEARRLIAPVVKRCRELIGERYIDRVEEDKFK